MNEKNTITVKDEKGNTKVCDILFTFDNDETKKSYIVYTDNTKDELGNIKVYASIFNPKEKSSKLEEIKTEKEWKYIDTILKTLQEEMTNKGE